MTIEYWDACSWADKPGYLTEDEWTDLKRVAGCFIDIPDLVQSTVGRYILPKDPRRPTYLPAQQPWLISEQPTFFPEHVPAPPSPPPPVAPPVQSHPVMELPPGGVSWHNPALGEYVFQDSSGNMSIQVADMPPIQTTMEDTVPLGQQPTYLDPRWAPIVPDWLEPWILDPATPQTPAIPAPLVAPVIGPQPAITGPGTIVAQPPSNGGGNWVYKKHCGSYRWVQQKRRRRRQLVSRTDIRGLAALKGVLGQGKAMEVWIATHG